jgi:hypothetical protein
LRPRCGTSLQEVPEPVCVLTELVQRIVETRQRVPIRAHERLVRVEPVQQTLSTGSGSIELHARLQLSVCRDRDESLLDRLKQRPFERPQL